MVAQVALGGDFLPGAVTCPESEANEADGFPDVGVEQDRCGGTPFERNFLFQYVLFVMLQATQVFEVSCQLGGHGADNFDFLRRPARFVPSALNCTDHFSGNHQGHKQGIFG